MDGDVAVRIEEGRRRDGQSLKQVFNVFNALLCEGVRRGRRPATSVVGAIRALS